MFDRIDLIALAGTIAIWALVFELVRRRRLKEKYSILWLFTASVLVLLSAARGLLDRVAAAVGIHYAPSALFLVAVVFLTLLTLQFSLVISILSRRNKLLAQEVALLKLRLEEVEGAIRPSAPSRSG